MTAHVFKADFVPAPDDLDDSVRNPLGPSRGIGLGLLLGAAGWIVVLCLLF